MSKSANIYKYKMYLDYFGQICRSRCNFFAGHYAIVDIFLRATRDIDEMLICLASIEGEKVILFQGPLSETQILFEGHSFNPKIFSRATHFSLRPRFPIVNDRSLRYSVINAK